MKQKLKKGFIVLVLLVSNVIYAQRDPSGIDLMFENLAKFLLILFVLVIIGTVLIIVFFVTRKKSKTERENQKLQEFPDSKLIKTLPYSTLILVFGILSILTSCFIIIGLPLGIIALILAIKATKTYAINPEGYTGIQNVRIGKVLAIIGIIFNGYFVLKFMIPVLL